MNSQPSLVNHALPVLSACCFVLLLTGCASPASTGEGDNVQIADRECRTAGSAGTKMKRSVCMSAEEWALADARDNEKEDLQNEYFRRMRENSTQGPSPGFSSPTPSAGL